MLAVTPILQNDLFINTFLRFSYTVKFLLKLYLDNSLVLNLNMPRLIIANINRQSYIDSL